jgi:prevent-host-death family protein
MVTVSIRELKAHLSEIIRRVDERREPVEVTRGGKVVVRIEPVEQAPDLQSIEAFWRRHDQLAREIGEKWPGGLSAVDALAADRRDR